VSEREAARTFGLSRETVRKMLKFSLPPGYRRQAPIRRPKLQAYIAVIDQILESDKSIHRKQRHRLVYSTSADADSPIPGALMLFAGVFNIFVAALNILLRVLNGGRRG